MFWLGQLSSQEIKYVEINTYYLITQGKTKPKLIKANNIVFNEHKHHH